MGLMFAVPELLVGAVIPLTFLGITVIASPDEQPSLSVTRDLSASSVRPGTVVEVTLSVTNTGDRVLPDVRVVEHVQSLAVCDGSTMGATALVPGESITIEYAIIATAGTHTFEKPVVTLRAITGGARERFEPAVDGDRTLDCRPGGEPTSNESSQTGDGQGRGVEFHATRAYQPGDSIRQIDWRHMAKTGDLITVQYRDREPLRTAVIVDARAINRHRLAPHAPSFLTLVIEGTRELLAQQNQPAELAGIGAIGPHTSTASDGQTLPVWVDISRDQIQALDYLTTLREWAGMVGAAKEGSSIDANTSLGETRGKTVATGTAPGAPNDDQQGESLGTEGIHDTEAKTAEKFSSPPERSTPDSPPQQLQRLLAEISGTTRVVFCSPLLDDESVELARTIADSGNALVVLSPQAPVITADSIHGRLMNIDRRCRLQRLEAFCTPVDWCIGDPLNWTEVVTK